MKIVTHGTNHNSTVPLSFMKHFSIFELIVLVLWLATLLFWFSLTAHINLVSSEKVLINPPYATCFNWWSIDCIKEVDVATVTSPIGLWTTVLKPWVWHFGRHHLGLFATNWITPCWPLDRIQIQGTSTLASLFRPGSYVHFFYTVYVVNTVEHLATKLHGHQMDKTSIPQM